MVSARETTAPSLALGVRIVDLVASSPVPLTMTEVVDRLDIPKSSAHRLLGTLVDEQVLVRRVRDKTFRLAPRWSSLGEANRQQDLVRGFLGLAEPLAEAEQETFQLAVPAGQYVTFVAYVDSPLPVRLACHIGRQLPQHASATGKAILAFSRGAAVDTVLNAGLSSLTARTITDPDTLLRQLDLVRERGYALEEEESSRSLSCIAAPVLGRAGNAVAAITCCLPLATLPAALVERLAPQVVEAARALAAVVVNE